MKKILATILTAAMLLSVSACGNEGGNANNSDNGTSAPTSSAPTSSAPEGSGSDDGTKAPENTSGSSDISVDWSKYPADFSDWTAQNLADYFMEAVDFPSDCEAWVQDHAEYWAGFPVYECSGIWNADGDDDIMAIFVTFNPDSPDTKPEEVEAIKQAIRDDKNHDYTTEDIFLGPQDHMVGHVSFSYGFSTMNEEVCDGIEAAYNYLVQELGLTPDF